jgi:hypothetical protein
LCSNLLRSPISCLALRNATRPRARHLLPLVELQDELVALLGAHSPVPVTYAGGVRDAADLERVARLGRGRVDASVGSALDIFGGSLPYTDVVAWSRAQQAASAAAAAALTRSVAAAGAGAAASAAE